MSVPRGDTARDTSLVAPTMFEFSGVLVPCWRCHAEIELLVYENPTEDHLCAECAEYYETY